MVAELDVYRTALVLIRQHGADAPIHAAMRHYALLDRGDLEGAFVWKRVLAAVDALLVTERPMQQRSNETVFMSTTRGF
jgi:hypothetical protein